MFILITRQLEQSEKFSDILNKENIKNFIFPVIEIKKIKLRALDLENIRGSNFIIFTSQNSVISLIQELDIKDLIGKKIAAIGIRVSKWIAYHGFAINIENDLSKYRNIIPCGISDKEVTNLKKINNQDYTNLSDIIINNFTKNLEI